MKKNILMMTILAAAIMAAACGKKEEAKETETAVVTEAAAETEAAKEAESSEALEAETEAPTDAEGNPLEEQYFTGVVSAMTATSLTITGDDGTNKSFDISNMERNPEDMLMPGVYAEAAYYEDGKETPAANYVSVMMNIEEQADAMGVDPVLYGTVKFMDENDLIVDDLNGVEHVFNNSISRKVSFGEVQEGSEVMVTYIGTIDEEAQKDTEDGTGSGSPLALKIVTMDAASSEDAQKNCISGVVNSVENGVLLLDTFAESFEFTGDPAIFAGLEGEENVTVYYEGAIGNRSVAATSVTIN